MADEATSPLDENRLTAARLAKIEAMRCYESQFAHKDGIDERIRAAAVMTGSISNG